MNVNQLLFIILTFAFVPCAQSIEPQEEETVGRHGYMLHGEDIPCEIIVEIFKKLPIADIVRSSLVCKRWHGLSEESQLWKEVRNTIHGDYPEKESIKENAKIHWLRVMVNTHADLEKIEYLVNKYELNKNHPFIPYRVLLIMFLFTKEIIDERAAQGDEPLKGKQMDSLMDGTAMRKILKQPSIVIGVCFKKAKRRLLKLELQAFILMGIAASKLYLP
jgi:hypothetical protein